MSGFDQFLQAPVAQRVFAVLFMATVIFGYHWVSYLYSRRVGKRWSLFGNPFEELTGYSLKEWLILIGLLGLSFLFLLMAVAMG